MDVCSRSGSVAGFFLSHFEGTVLRFVLHCSHNRLSHSLQRVWYVRHLARNVFPAFNLISLLDKRFSIEVNLEQTFFPEYIIKERKVKGKIEFLIKWKGFSTKESTWEPKSSFLSDTVLLSDWHQRQLADEFSESFPWVKRVKFCLSSEVVHQRALDVPR